MRLIQSTEDLYWSSNPPVIFSAPGTSIDSTTFGQVTSQRNLPRKVQFNARLSF